MPYTILSNAITETKSTTITTILGEIRESTIIEQHKLMLQSNTPQDSNTVVLGRDKIEPKTRYEELVMDATPCLTSPSLNTPWGKMRRYLTGGYLDIRKQMDDDFVVSKITTQPFIVVVTEEEEDSAVLNVLLTKQEVSGGEKVPFIQQKGTESLQLELPPLLSDEDYQRNVTDMGIAYDQKQELMVTNTDFIDEGGGIQEKKVNNENVDFTPLGLYHNTDSTFNSRNAVTSSQTNITTCFPEQSNDLNYLNQLYHV